MTGDAVARPSSPRCRSASSTACRVLDLDYAEDSGCDTDMNVVMTGGGGFVEVQGTAEGAPFSRARDGRAGGARGRRHRANSSRRNEQAPADVDLAPRPGVGQRRQAARVPAPAGAARDRRDRAGRTRHYRGRRAACDVRRERAGQGAPRERARAACRRWPTIPASASTALGGAPGVQSRALCRRAAVRRAQQREAGRRAARRRRPPRALLLACWCWCAMPTIPSRCIAEGRWHGIDHRRRRAATAASATTRISWTSDGTDRRRAAARAEERAFASRKGHRDLLRQAGSPIRVHES